jgi:hypothetical protein
MAECAAITSSRNLLGVQPGEPFTVYYHSGEDPFDELWRRFAGVFTYHNIEKEEVDMLYISSGRDLPLILATQAKGIPQRNEKTIAWVKATLKEKKIDVWSFGPLASMHELNENDNGHMNFLMRILSEIAQECNCAVHFEHHARKLGNGENAVTTDTARGASAIIAAVRSARTLNVMTKEEATELGVKDNRRQYFRVDNARASMLPPSDEAQWLKIVPVDLGNGDNVGVATAWEPDYAGLLEGITPAMIQATLDGIRQSDQWREDRRSNTWIGIGLAGGLGIDATSDNGQQRLAGIIRKWLREGVLRVVVRPDKHRKPRPFVEAPAAP